MTFFKNHQKIIDKKIVTTIFTRAGFIFPLGFSFFSSEAEVGGWGCNHGLCSGYHRMNGWPRLGRVLEADVFGWPDLGQIDHRFRRPCQQLIVWCRGGQVRHRLCAIDSRDHRGVVQTWGSVSDVFVWVLLLLSFGLGSLVV